MTNEPQKTTEKINWATFLWGVILGLSIAIFILLLAKRKALPSASEIGLRLAP